MTTVEIEEYKLLYAIYLRAKEVVSDKPSISEEYQKKELSLLVQQYETMKGE